MKEFIKKNIYLLALAILDFLLVYASSFNTQYGYFIDEFYYIACANRPAFGYVDHPPLAPLLLTAFSFLFGTSLYSIRFLPAVTAAASVFLTGKLAEMIGGKSYASVLAALAFLCNPVLVAVAGFYSMNSFEPLLTIIMLLLIIKIIKSGNTKEWIPVGIVMGLGVMNKHTFVIAVVFLAISLILTGHYRLFVNRWFFIGCGIAFIIVLPNILWQVFNGFPSVEFYRNISTGKNIYTPPLAFIINQIINMSPAAMLVWFAGVIYLLVNKQLRQYRFLSVFFIFVFLFMMLSGTSRADRTLFAYPAVLAGGAVFYENLLNRYKTRALKMIIPVLLLVFCTISIPLTIPYFSYSTAAGYVKNTGFNTEIEKGKKPPLPQLLSDRIGWKEKADLLYKEYDVLTDAEKKETIISTDNYGKAGALELWGREHGINEVFCGHNSYYLWGRNNLHGSIVLALDDEDSYKNYKKGFDSVVVGSGMFTNPYVSPHENNLRVFICRKPKASLRELFDMGKVFN